MSEETLRWGIGLLISLAGALALGNLWFLRRSITKSDESHDQLIAINTSLASLTETVKELKSQIGHVADLRAKMAMLEMRIFGRPRSNGHDKTDTENLDLDS